MTHDRLDDLLREAAQDYHRPPDTPREEIWQRIAQAREGGTDTPVIPLAERPGSRRLGYMPLLALAAVLLLGVAIGRLTLRPSTGEPPIAASSGPATPTEREPTLASRLAAIQHLTRVEALLVDYQTGRIDGEFDQITRELLTRTRLWLDADRTGDARMRRLFEDLELVLLQIAQLASDGPAEEREFIDHGMAERQIRPRLRNAIPAGPAA